MRIKIENEGYNGTINCKIIYSGVNRSIQAQSDVMIWIINQSHTHTHHYYVHKLSERITEIKLTNGLYTPEEGRVEKN